MTGRPWALRALALASTARVALSAMAPMRGRLGGGRWDPSRRPCSHCSGMPCARSALRSRPGSGHCAVALRRVCRFAPGCEPPVCCPFGCFRGHAPACPQVTRPDPQVRVKGNSSIGRAPVSKTGGWGFESLLPCVRLYDLCREEAAVTSRPSRAPTEGSTTDSTGSRAVRQKRSDGQPGQPVLRGDRRCSSVRSSTSCARSCARPAPSCSTTRSSSSSSCLPSWRSSRGWTSSSTGSSCGLRRHLTVPPASGAGGSHSGAPRPTTQGK
jgi:hypothetical protein